MARENASTAETMDPESDSGVQVRASLRESMRAALSRAPRLVLTDAERAEWDEAETSVARWVPHEEAMGILRGDDV